MSTRVKQQLTSEEVELRWGARISLEYSKESLPQYYCMLTQ